MLDQRTDQQRELAKVRKNYQLTIPQGLREKVGISEGDYVQLVFKDGSIFIKPISVSQRSDGEREGKAEAPELIYEEVRPI